MLLDVVFESWVLEEIVVFFKGVSFNGSLSIDLISWVLMKIKLDTRVLKDGIIIFDSGVLKDISVELDSWLLGI
jgi:hypothetical protein